MSRSKLPKNIGSGHYPKSHKEEQEYGPGKKGIGMCSACSAGYMQKSWRHNLEEHKKVNKDARLRFMICPACQMAKDKKFEGQLFIENIPPDILKDVERLVYNVADRAYRRDPMDRILVLRKYAKNGLEARTSENQLALRIGKQIARAYKGSECETRWSDEESAGRVRVRFPKV